MLRTDNKNYDIIKYIIIDHRVLSASEPNLY